MLAKVGRFLWKYGVQLLYNNYCVYARWEIIIIRAMWRDLLLLLLFSSTVVVIIFIIINCNNNNNNNNNYNNNKPGLCKLAQQKYFEIFRIGNP